MSKVIWTKTFENAFKKALKTYPREEQNIKGRINNQHQEHNHSITAPGYSPPVQKMRLPLPAYNISQSAGLRLFFTILGAFIYPIYIYKKGHVKEKDVQKNTHKHLKDIVKELSDK